MKVGQRFGAYEVLDRLGEGGMGEVYRARDTRLKRDVAIKVLPESLAADPERLARFQREAEVLAALNHPNIAAIYGLEDSTDTKALVMELVDGPTLADRIARGPLPVDEALPIAGQIAEALEAAHEQGIVHRDLKPANIKVRDDGTVKVLDFGLAKAMDPPVGSSPNVSLSPTITSPAMTQAGVILGTAAYMSPEQAKGKPVDRRADIWAFGCVLFEMLAGQRAFPGEDLTDTLAAVVKLDPEWGALPAGLPPSISWLLRRCLEKDPKARLQAIGEARIAAEEAMHGAVRGVEVAPQGTAPRSVMAWKIATGVLGAAAVALGAMAVGQRREPVPTGPVVRFQIPSPGTSTGLFRGSQPTVSPDGRRVAFRAAGQLWLYSLESSTSQPIPGTAGNGTNDPGFFWSPDSQHLAFRVNAGLQKFAMDGGRPETIADRPNRFGGGTWNHEGVIVFAGEQGLMQVSDQGGTPTVLIPNESPGLDRMWSPRFLPDGRHFLFSAGAAERQAQVHIGTLDRSEPPRPLPGATGLVAGYAVSSTTGLVHVLFGRPGLLVAQAFDTRRLELTGAPIQIETDVEPGTPAIATTSTTGVVTHESAGAPGTFQLTWFDRTGNTVGTLSTAESLEAPNLSRDGRLLAIERRDASGQSDVWVIDVARGTNTPVTTGPEDETRPVFSPDGARVAFTRASKVYVKATGGTGPEDEVGEGETTDWSPDGRFISVLLRGDLWALPVSGDRTPARIAEGSSSERRGRFSPDGRWIAYESNLSGRYQIYLQPFPTATTRIPVSALGGDSAYWRADGRQLFFRAPGSRIMSVDLTPGPVPQLGAPRELFALPTSLPDGRFVVTPDGERFLVPVEVKAEEPKTMRVIVNWPELMKKAAP